MRLLVDQGWRDHRDHHQRAAAEGESLPDLEGQRESADGELADFELKLKSRVRGEGAINNGFQFRSKLTEESVGYRRLSGGQQPERRRRQPVAGAAVR